jgi:hypothetical protein
MKIFIYLFIVTNSCLIAQVDTTLINKCRRYLYDQDSVCYPFIYDLKKDKFTKKSFEEAKHYYVFVREIKTPLLKTCFLLYKELTMDPNPHFIVASYDNKLQVLKNEYCEARYGCNLLVDFLNQRLIDEEPLNNDQLFSLAQSIGELSSPKWFPSQIISKYDEVWWKTNSGIEYLPDSLRHIIKPFSIEMQDKNAFLRYFIWNSMTLSEVSMLYNNKIISLNVKRIGKFLDIFIQ